MVNIYYEKKKLNYFKQASTLINIVGQLSYLTVAVCALTNTKNRHIEELHLFAMLCGISRGAFTLFNIFD